MSSDALLEARAELRPRSWCPHEPHPKQAEFLALTALEALYGGAAGGGKSDALLMAALQYVDVPGYAALLLRRTYADLALPGAIMDRSHTWLAGTEAHWDGQNHRWTLPSGATLTFGYLDTERDKYRYQGAELQFVGVDEMTQFPVGWYTYLLSRLRRLVGSKVPVRARGATNPGGIGHKWVKERFVDAATAVGPFIPSTLDDNPFIDAEAYELSLARLDPVTRQQLRHGVWVQDSGGLVYGSFNRSLVVPMPVKRGRWRHILSWDFGFTDECAWGVHGWEEHSKVVYKLLSEKRAGMIPSECAEKTKELDAKFHFDRIVGDLGGLGKGYGEEMRRRYQVPIEAAEKQNKLGYIKLFNGAMVRREFLVVAGANEPLIEEFEELPWENEERRKEAPGLPNHCTDENLYGWKAACAWAESDAEPEKPKPGTPEYDAYIMQKEREESIARFQKAQALKWKSKAHGRWTR